ncbi:hypothetical protein ACP6L2_01045 [Sphingobacterium lactis]|uniref:hypothetical protein n=1 Tax=Sphingobacterium lactis TaxID=797291 RepID=UPI003F81D9EB
MENLVVTQVNPESKSMTTILGISEERSQELAELISNEFAKNNSKVSVLENISKEAKNVNELAFLAFSLGSLVEHLSSLSSNPLAMLSALIGGRV